MKMIGAEDAIQLDLPASYKYLPVIGACLRALLEREQGLAQREILAYNVELAIYEACTNIVEHAYDDAKGRLRATVTMLPDPRRLVVDLYDTGTEFDLSTVREPDLDEPQVQGYGLFLVHQLLDKVVYQRLSETNHWHLEKNL